MAGRTGAAQRPGNARRADDGMKLHRRAVRLDGRTRTVIGLRPGTAVRFGTNRFHGTWHVLSDRHGARVLGRMLWGLSYQARPGTVLVVDRPFLVPTPFDADPPDPVVLVPGWCTPFARRAARDLARRLPLRAAPDGTVRWRTHGLDAALREEPDWERDSWRWAESGRVERTHGLIVLAPATPREARLWGLGAARLDPSGRFGMDYTFLGEWDHSVPGEIQVFRDFHRDVGRARWARAEILARPDAPSDAADLRPLIWRRHGAIGRGRSRLVRNCRPLGRRDAEALEAAGVPTLDSLAAHGPVEAYLLLRGRAARRVDEDLLWTLEAAVTGAAPRDVAPARRAELLSELATRTKRPPRAPGR
ncbi:TfoX/Sxy family DNA transformation protein [Actinomadura rifamycini]|uniref:TfoX/Sxy family DNA transformation protein n=1 Tax=Actinomadura rifamycini TaxID=31962 RepID=UPI000401E614|nr:TfoX/Sxy family DNA transformation protein [Actinomadura rifamycini]